MARAFRPGIRTAGLSLPRGEGKSAFAADLLARCLTPGDPLHKAGAEYLLLAASLPQARNVFRPLRVELESRGREYRFIDSVMRIGITHKPTNTKLTVLSSNAKSAFGIVDCPLLIADEPGAWEITGGQLMYDAISTAQGKPDSSLRALFLGTLAPMATASGHWWYDLIHAGSTGSTYIEHLKGDTETWDQWPTIARANPLKWKYPESRAVLLEERDAARADSRLKARFLSYRLNIPTQDESTGLLTVDDWKLAMERPVGIPAGRPIVGIDLGAGRAWSAAVAMWESGRVEAMAVAPGIPDLAAQETRDNVPTGTYSLLFENSSLTVSEGLRVQSVGDSVGDRLR